MSRLNALREAAARSPHNVSLLLLLGRACIDELQLQDAREAFDRVLTIEPDHLEAQLGLGLVLFLQGDTSGAAVRAERALHVDPAFAPAHLLLSRVFLSEGDRTKAVEHFDRAAEIDGTISDPSLEQDLGRTVRDARRAPSGPSLEPMPPDSPLVDSGGDFFDDPYADEPPLDWRPETFYAPGDPDRGEVTFADVGGMEALKEEIRLKIIYPLQHPDLYKAYGRRTGGGMLIYGPPGCGKTLLLRAVAGEVPCNFMAVGLHEIFDPYAGSSERNLHQIFQTARAHAPCVLVFDDLDSLAADRRQVREGQLRNLVNQFLHEMDGIRGENQRILVIGATNQPWHLDPAFRRPGRFDQVIFVPPPDEPGRAQIIELLARDKPIAELDTARLVAATQGFSGADLKWLFDRAAELTLADAIHSGQPVPITMDLLVEVATGQQPSTRAWFEGFQNQVPAAGTDGIYGEVRKFLLNAPSARER